MAAGNSSLSGPEVAAFYSSWTNYTTVKDFAWADKYNPAAAPNRKVCISLLFCMLTGPSQLVLYSKHCLSRYHAELLLRFTPDASFRYSKINKTCLFRTHCLQQQCKDMPTVAFADVVTCRIRLRKITVKYLCSHVDLDRFWCSMS